MPEAIRLLRKEHANIAKLLNVLEGQLALIDEAQRPDHDVLKGVADYFLDYPDRCHHPKEDVIFRKLKERDPAAARLAGDLEAEHGEIARSARRLSEAVKNLQEDVEVPRDAIHRVISRFIDSEREHMKMEEETFFPAALSSLTPEDWEAIDARITDRADPLFGYEVEKQFENLSEHILKWERENAGADEGAGGGGKPPE